MQRYADASHLECTNLKLQVGLRIGSLDKKWMTKEKEFIGLELAGGMVRMLLHQMLDCSNRKASQCCLQLA